jgi:hypothetical protein
MQTTEQLAYKATGVEERDVVTHTVVHEPPAGRGRRIVRALGGSLAVVLAFVLVPAAVFATGANAYEASRYTQPEATTTTAAAVAAASPPAHDPSKPTAAIVVGASGANIADTLAPYEVLATTEAFNVYTVAPERRPLPLLGGLDLIPDLSFAQLQERLGDSAPDVTIVPDMPEDQSSDATVTAWLQDTASRATGSCWACAPAPGRWPRQACWTAAMRPHTGTGSPRSKTTIPQ